MIRIVLTKGEKNLDAIFERVYYEDSYVRIRTMCDADAAFFCREEQLQGWHATEEKYRGRIRDAQAGRALALTAEFGGVPAGYVSLYFEASAGPFAGSGLPEIVDFGVLEKMRRRGVGSRLMDAAEALAAQRADVVTIGVGMHSGYGSAQRMYVKRGFIPDGSGVWFQDKPATPYGQVENGDGLVLYLSKRLR